MNGENVAEFEALPILLTKSIGNKNKNKTKVKFFAYEKKENCL